MYCKWQSYDVWFLRYEVWQTEFFVILDRFLHFYPPTNQKNQNFEKLKKKRPRDIIILHKSTKNHDHMLHCSLDMLCNKCNGYFSFWVIFCPFTSLTAQKIKIWIKWKKYLEISFYNSIPKIMIRRYTLPEIWCMKDVIIFHFGPFVYQKLWSDDVWFMGHGAQQIDRQMEKVTYRGGCPT